MDKDGDREPEGVLAVQPEEATSLDVAKPPVAGLGVDIVEIARMQRAVSRSPHFAQRVFTEHERAYCDAKARPEQSYAAHFAAKEAVVKALGCGFSAGIKITDVEVSHNGKGRPFVILHGAAARTATAQGVVSLPISLSHTHDTAIANAVAVTSAVQPHPDEREDPKARLAAAFKEARSLLDDLGPTDGNGAQGVPVQTVPRRVEEGPEEAEATDVTDDVGDERSLTV